MRCRPTLTRERCAVSKRPPSSMNSAGKWSGWASKPEGAHMNSENGYLYLNLANEWPGFLLTGSLEIAPDGAIRLKQLADGTFALRGVFRGGPFMASAAPTPWHRLQAYTEALPP